MAGTSYFGPVAGHGIQTHDLDLIRMERSKQHIEKSGRIDGPVEALPAPAEADNYVAVKKKEEKSKDEEK